MNANKVTTMRPRLPHLILTTTSIDAVLNWYCNALRMDLVHRTDMPDSKHEDEQLHKAAWVSNDETEHRLLFVELPKLAATDELHHPRLQHFTFEYPHIDELLKTYARLKEQRILPVQCTDSDAKTAFYYEDPDRNRVELSVDDYADRCASDEHVQYSPEFDESPMEYYVDPDQLIAARKAGVSPWELHERVRAGEFAPAKLSAFQLSQLHA
ncbi:VOC family protein [Granulicella arctica]|uniref:Catechol 2,3-dioxygenase-like lactoylglutathione lyase family enzyme n=1 Tax=Granulicella arctica TaxID=940613 RepID=A0A7Y9TEY6_9BACT|nr:VOC family protein [Granulicella arctica]NYF77739.1 catechol 2,3-dioxygenase-like lactoylglutathione lyase family enzyme [Granulicella arctica]